MAVETVAPAAALIWSCRCGCQFLLEFFILDLRGVIQTFSHQFFIGKEKKVGNFASSLDTPQTHAIQIELIEFTLILCVILWHTHAHGRSGQEREKEMKMLFNFTKENKTVELHHKCEFHSADVH